MNTLILLPTEISQWHALVNEAQVTAEIILEESTESYLVFLLHRYTRGSQLMESVLALDFLNSMKVKSSRKFELWRDVGDKSLLFCGLFPGLAKKRRVNLNYFVEIGQTAYYLVGESEETSSSSLYLQLSEQFPKLKHILQAMRTEYLPMSMQ